MIFGEENVDATLHWNSRNDSIVGHAMRREEMASLHDLYTTLEEDHGAERADYVLQTMWRDLTSDYDILGAYYMNAGQLKGKFMLACVMDALLIFNAYNFEVHLLVCDGASTNLTMKRVFPAQHSGYVYIMQEKARVIHTCLM